PLVCALVTPLGTSAAPTATSAATVMTIPIRIDRLPLMLSPTPPVVTTRSALGSSARAPPGSSANSRRVSPEPDFMTAALPGPELHQLLADARTEHLEVAWS